MTPHLATALLSAVLLAMSSWAYLGSDTPSLTALIPAGFGLALLACYPGVKRESKVVAHIAVLLTVILTLALLMPFRGAIRRGDPGAMVRVGAMIAAAVMAIASYVRSFRAARRAQKFQ